MSDISNKVVREISVRNVIEMIFQVRGIGAIDYDRLGYVLDLDKEGLDKIVNSSNKFRYDDEGDNYLYYREEGYT